MKIDTIAAIVLVVLVLMNFSAYAAFGIDKARATAEGRRISESTLLLLALLGGTLGAYAGRKAFRHKTRKQPFGTLLLGIASLQVIGLVLGLGWVTLNWLARPA